MQPKQKASEVGLVNRNSALMRLRADPARILSDAGFTKGMYHAARGVW